MRTIGAMWTTELDDLVGLSNLGDSAIHPAHSGAFFKASNKTILVCTKSWIDILSKNMNIFSVSSTNPKLRG